HKCFMGASRRCNHSGVSVYYGGSTNHNGLGLLARPPAYDLCEPLACAQMASVMDAGRDSRRGWLAVVRNVPRDSALWRAAALSSAPRGYSSGHNGDRAVHRIET